MNQAQLMSSVPQLASYRLEGVDLARGLAVIGMVFVNFMYVFCYTHIAQLEQDESAWFAYSEIGIALALVVLVGFAGRAVGVFLVLFGIGLMLQAKRATHRRGPALQIRRYLILLLGGLAFLPIWEADILHYIGLFGLFGLTLVTLRAPWLLAVGVGVLVNAELMRHLFDYRTGWGAIGTHYEDMWSLTGQMRQLLFNGYHPVFPWLSLVIYGMFLGRLDLREPTTLRRLIGWGVLASGVGFALAMAGVPAEFFPAHTLFILLSASNATWVIAVCLRFCAKGSSRRGGVLRDIGRLALSHYVGHVLLGIVPVMVITHERTDMSFEGAFAIAVAYLTATAVLGRLWLRGHAQGPLERFLRGAAARPVTMWFRRGDETSDTPTA